MKKMICIFLLFVCLKAVSQPFEIRAVNAGNGIIGVEMRTTGMPVTTTNYLTDLVFGLKWLSAYNIDLGSILGTSYNIKKSDTRKLKNGYHFQAFYADNIPFLFPAVWQQNVWIEIMRITNTRTGMGSGNFEICETGFDPTTDPNIGVDLVDRTPVINGSATLVPLPVSLLKFEATAQEKDIRLMWQTASEYNNNGFTVQRSKDANVFDSLGWVTGRGTTTTVFDYAFTDKNTQANVLYYYRLRQQNFDNKVSFSEIRSARVSTSEKDAFRLSPNPAGSTLTVLYVGGGINGKANIKIVDAKGAVVVETEKTINAGVPINLDLSPIINGHYYFVVEQKKEIIFKQAFQKLK